MQNMESILRALLSYPNMPAVILTASFSLMGKIRMGEDVHLPVAQYYDTPVIMYVANCFCALTWLTTCGIG